MSRLIFILFVSTFYLQAQSIDQGLDFYAQSDYTASLKVWEALIAKGFRDKELYYNQANCYYKLKKYPEAILFYQKAIAIDPSYADAKDNLRSAEGQAGIEDISLPQFFLLSWFLRLGNALSVFFWWSLGAFLFSTSIWIWYKVRYLRYFSLLLGFFALIASCLAIYQTMQSGDRTKAILMENNSILLSPDTLSTAKTELLAGETLFLIDHLDPWVKVQTKSYDAGWILKSKLRFVMDSL